VDRFFKKIAVEIADAGGRAYYVGGRVRDHLRGIPCLDRDIEVYGLPLSRLQKLLRAHGRVEAVGRAFGVLKFFAAAGEADFSLPRRESLTGSGHRGFTVDLDPSITPAEACARRDFTVNAMLMDLLTEEISDFHGGRRDLDAGLLRHVGPAFAEDPLRVYRMVQLGGRLDLRPHTSTLELARGMDLDDLAPERIFAEFAKLFLLAERPSLGMEIALQAGVLEYHPELKAMVDCPQDPEWHPEGDVWTHTLMVLDAAAGLRVGDRQEDLALMFGALCHDLGKPATTGEKEGRIVSPGHAEAGIDPATRFMTSISADRRLLEQVLEFVRYHLRPAEFHRVRDQIGNASIRRLALKTNIQDLVRLARADHLGRTNPDALAGKFPAGDWLLAKAEALAVRREAPHPLLQGRDLLKRGWTPGPTMGRALEKAFQAQLDGAFTELPDALDWLDANIEALKADDTKESPDVQ
jgi:tRNA nucleotidyltransferase (CCA-adding enzyme)